MQIFTRDFRAVSQRPSGTRGGFVTACRAGRAGSKPSGLSPGEGGERVPRGNAIL